MKFGNHWKNSICKKNYLEMKTKKTYGFGLNLVGNLNDLRSLILCWNGNFLYKGIDPSESLRLSLTSTSCFSSDTSLGPRVFDRLTFIASFILTFGLAPEVILMKTHSVFVSLSAENVKKICKFSDENSLECIF